MYQFKNTASTVLERNRADIGRDRIRDEQDYYPINSYGMIGDMHTAALINPDGGVDWACFPYFDSPSLFAKILDHKKGGSFRISPRHYQKSQMTYLESTNILQTIFSGKGSRFVLTDFMPVGHSDGIKTDPKTAFICRELHCIQGSNEEVEIFFDPAPDYARKKTSLQHTSNRVWSNDSRFEIILSKSATWSNDSRKGRFTLSAGDRVQVIFCYGKVSSSINPKGFFSKELRQTEQFWKNWIRRSLYQGRWKEHVERSALVLKLMTFKPTGAIIASPTTSLPESIGGERNWDYRFSWLRDSALTLNALFLLGYKEEAESYKKWLSDSIRRHGDHVHILYPVNCRGTTHETTLDHLNGYKGSRPVRIGNAATGQIQLDVYGEILDFFYLYSVYGEPIDRDLWRYIRILADNICKNWHLHDEGIWEVRDKKRHFTYSKLMCWVGLDRAIRISEEYGFPGNLTRWKNVKNEVAAFVTASCIDPAGKYFTQSTENMIADASSLLIPHFSFLPATDEIMQNTINATLNQLTENNLVYRYKNKDGLQGKEGAFNICTFWLVEALAASGRVEEAEKYFNHMINLTTPLGLYAEETEPKTLEALGNYPQALTHIGLINAAHALNKAIGSRHQ